MCQICHIPVNADINGRCNHCSSRCAHIYLHVLHPHQSWRQPAHACQSVSSITDVIQNTRWHIQDDMTRHMEYGLLVISFNHHEMYLLTAVLTIKSATMYSCCAGHGHLVVATATQCCIYGLASLSTPHILDLKEAPMLILHAERYAESCLAL